MSSFSCRSSPVLARIDRRIHQVSSKIGENSKCALQHITDPNLAIIGAFNGTNVGDNSLGLSILNLAKEHELSGVLQNFYSLQKWKSCEYNICAGGATGVESNLTKLIQKKKINKSKIALIGMDFSADVDRFPDDILSFLSELKFISCRSQRQANLLSSVLGREVIYHFDNAFAYPFTAQTNELDKQLKKQKILGFNSLPFCMYWNKNKFQVGSLLEPWYRKIGSDIVQYLNLFGPAYIQLISKTIEQYSRQGWEIIHVPFTPEDDLFARTFFDKNMVKFSKYQSSPNQIFNLIKNCRVFIPTRYHALIFCLIGQIPCIPILYAIKCCDLLDDLGIDINLGITRMELVSTGNRSESKLLDPSNAITLNTQDLNRFCLETKNTINSSINSINN